MNKIYRIINYIIKKSYWYFQYWQGSSKFWNVPFDLDFVNLGSSLAFFNFDYENKNGMNWALPKQSLDYDFKILKNYFSYLKKDAVVIISIDLFSFVSPEYNKLLNLRYYTILHPATINNFEDTERTKAYKIRQNPFKIMPLYCMRAFAKEIFEFIIYTFHFICKRYDFRKSAEALIDVYKKQVGKGFFSTSLSDSEINGIKCSRQTIEDIVCFCTERDLKPVIAIPPVHSSLLNQLDTELIDKTFCCFFNGINVPIYNYLYSKDFNSDELFSSILCLNKKGSLKFTDDLLNRLKKDEILKSRLINRKTKKSFFGSIIDGFHLHLRDKETRTFFS